MSAMANRSAVRLASALLLAAALHAGADEGSVDVVAESAAPDAVAADQPPAEPASLTSETIAVAPVAPVPGSQSEAAPAMAAADSGGLPGAEDICAPPGQASSVPRRRPGQSANPLLEYELPPCDGARIQTWSRPLDLGPPVPDRWRIMDAFYKENLLDPYANNNVLKGDKPIFGTDWFFSVLAVSDTVLEPRRFPVPVGNATTADTGALNTVGDGDQFVFNQNLILEFVLLQGDTVFRPPDWEFRFTPVFNYSDVHFDERGLLKVDPSAPDDGDGRRRREGFTGIQALFVDKHLRNTSDRFDFDSLRIGIQPFTSDFRGFLFSDSQLGIRLFGIRDNNQFQYNLAWFRRLEKDTNSGLNDVNQALREDDVFAANVYWQDMPVFGFTSQATVVYNRTREKGKIKYDENGFIARPSALFEERFARDYDVVYFGYSGDGHFDRWNVTTSLYYATGEQSSTRFPGDDEEINSFFAAAEVSRDFSWIRARASFLYATGDDDPSDDKAEGFDAIFENPLFAGADTSYWIRQTVPLIGGGGVFISGRNGVLNSLRSSKELGQSNFINPGTILAGVGADFDVLPHLRVSFNVNELWFDDTAVLERLRQQAPIDENIGTDVSVAVIWRPFVTQNIVFRISAAALLAGDGFEDLYGNDEDTPYSILGNFILQY